MLHKTDYGLVYNDDGSLCVTHQEDGAVAVEEGTENRFKNPSFNTSSASGGWNHWGTSGVNGSYGQTTDKKYIYGNQQYAHWVANAADSSSHYLCYQSPTLNGQPSYRSLTVILCMEDGSEVTNAKVFPSANSTTSQGAPTRQWTSIKNIPGTIFYVCKWEGFHQSGTNDLVGICVSQGYKVYISFAQLEDKPFATSFTEGIRPDGILAYPVTLKDDYTIACYRKSHTDVGYKHVVKRSDGTVFVDGVEDSEYDVGCIAGRNLAQGTASSGGWTSYTNAIVSEDLPIIRAESTRTSTGTFGIQQASNYRKINLEPDKTYTLSFKARGNISSFNYVYIMNTGVANQSIHGGAVKNSVESEEEFSEIQFSFTPNSNTANNGQSYVMISTSSNSVGGWFEIKDIKLEKGNKATDWTPAPEDLGYDGDLLMFSNHTGYIKDLKILPYIATDKEIKQMYSGVTFDVTDKGIVIADNYSEVGPMSGIIGWWPLDGHTDDYSGNNNHGTLGGSPSVTAFARQRGYSFLSSGDRVNIAPTGSGISTMTLSAWHKWHTTSSTWRTVFGHTGNFHHLIFASNRVVSLWDGSQRTFGYSSPDNEWHLYTIIIESGVRAELYVDGIYRGQSPTTLNLTAYPVHVIGNWGSGSYPAGSLSDARIYNRALSPEEIKILYDVTKPNAIPMQLSNDGTVYLSGELKEV